MLNKIDLHEFYVAGSDSERLHTLLHVSEPSTAREMNHGYFFAVIEIGGGTTADIEACQELISTLEKQYYSLPLGSEKHPFEVAIEYVNRRNHHLLGNRRKSLSMTCGVMSKGTLYFTTHGQSAIHLLFKKDDKLEDMELGESHETNTQLFPAIMQGDVSVDDIVYITTPRTMDYIPPDRMRKILEQKNPRQASMHVQQTLENVDSGLAFGGIILEMSRPVQGAAQEGPNDIDESSADEEPMSPPPRRHRADDMRRDIVSGASIAASRALIGTLKGIKSFIFGLGRTIVGLVLIVTNWGGQREEVLTSMGRSWHDMKERIETLPLFTKLLAIGVILLGLVFSGTVLVSRIHTREAEQIAAYDQTIQAIEDKKTAAEASAIYNDKAKAIALLEEAKTMAEALPDEAGEKRAKRTALLEAIQASRENLRGVTNVKPTLLATLPESSKATSLAKIGNTLIAYGPESKELQIVDLSSKAVNTKPLGSVEGLKKNYTPKEETNVVFIAKNGKFASYDKASGATSFIEIAGGALEKNPTDVVVYNQRLYVLDAETNQIYRHNKTQTGYDKGSAWIKSTSDISKATSMTVDGDIFVMDSTGNIHKFVGGNEQAFTPKDIDPPLSGEGIMWTYTDLPNLYILDTKESRVVILDKNGAMKAQYVSDAWRNPTGMVVDEAKKTIYVLEGNTISLFTF